MNWANTFSLKTNRWVTLQSRMLLWGIPHPARFELISCLCVCRLNMCPRPHENFSLPLARATLHTHLSNCCCLCKHCIFSKLFTFQNHAGERILVFDKLVKVTVFFFNYYC